MATVPGPQPAEDDQGGHSVAYRVVRAMFVVVFFWMFWKFGGFLLNMLVGSLYQAGAKSDAYFFAAQSVVYLLIFSCLLKILIPAFTPVFIEEKNKRGEDAAWDFASTVLNFTLLGCGVLLVIFYAYAEPITDTLVRGFGDEARTLGIQLLRWILPGAALMVLYLPMRAILNSYKIFSYPSAAEATQKIVWAVGLFVTYRFLHLGIFAIAVGFLIGTVGMALVTLFGLRDYAGNYHPGFPAMRKRRFVIEGLVAVVFLFCTIAALMVADRVIPLASKYRDITQLSVALVAVVSYTGFLWMRCKDREGVMARFATLAAPLVISTVFAAWRDVVTYYFQSFTTRGVFSDIEYGRRIVFVPTTIVAYGLSVAMFPYLCELASNKENKVLGELVTKAMRMLALGFVPLTVMTIILADPIARLVLDRGNWPPVHLQYTALALALLALGLVMYAWEMVIMQGFFSLQKMWTPALMGIAGTVFQFAFLAIPIYWLRYDYPIHVFFLAALAYPVSRYFKDLILLGLLKQHVSVLPLRKTAWFTLKLLVLTAAVGGATWVVNRQVAQRIDYTSTRQHKLVVSNFETGPDTWFSVNASDIGIEKSPAGDLAVAMQHKRQGNVRCSIYRRLAGLRLDSLEEVLVRFHAMVRDPAGGIVVEGERKKGFETVFEGDISHEDWTECEFSLAEPSQVETLHWREAASDRKKPNVLYIREVTISGPEGREIWTENFAQPGWSVLSTSDSQVPTLQNTRLDEEASRYALRIPAGGVERDLSGYNFSGTELFRCRLRNTTGEPATARIALHSGDKRVEQEVDLEPDGWQKIDLTAEKLGFKNLERFQAIDGVTISVPRDGIFLDDVTFRRPPSAKYELQKLIHCVIPTLGGMIVGLVTLLLLRFDETSDVIQWVKNKGWQRSEEDAEEMLE